ncbi:oxidoreductase, partial [bacterium K02(2017)]
MKQVLIKKGQAIIDDIPAPVLENETILVELSHSCISAGTELSGIKSSDMPLWKRAIKKPEQIKKALKMVSTDGVGKTKSFIQGKLAEGHPTGYSAAGRVIAIGSEIQDIKIGDRVACAGAQFAHHSELIKVPRNLVVPIPQSIDEAQASTVTLGAISLQGIRRL